MTHNKTFVAVLLTAALSSSAFAVVPHFDGFEDPSWAPDTNTWNDYTGGKIRRIASGSGILGVTSASGVAHAEIYDLTVGTDVFNNPSLGAPSPFTRFGGYSSTWDNGFIASTDFYLDPAWTDGQGFDYSVAINNTSGNHVRDFIFHVGVTGGSLVINESNNTDSNFNAFKLTAGTNYAVPSAGWYTLEHVFSEATGGFLSVDFNVRDADGALLSTANITTTDLVAGLGGNRYGWLTYNNINGLALDNTTLVPEPTSIAAIAGLAAMGLRRRRA